MAIEDGAAFRLDKLAAEVGVMRARSERIALCHGCFDVFHYGHLQHLMQARTLADRLVVTVTPDRFVDKGPGRPLFCERQRAELIASLRVVDAVAVNDRPTAVDAILAVRPDVFVKGADYQVAAANSTGLAAEREALTVIHARLAFTDTPKWSSSDLAKLGLPA